MHSAMLVRKLANAMVICFLVRALHTAESTSEDRLHRNSSSV
jgi:hypothetical protein